MVTLKASNLGIIKIKQARKAKGWNIDDYRWLEVASQFLKITFVRHTSLGNADLR